MLLESNEGRVTILEYIWIDGQKPTKELRSKTRVLHSRIVRNLKDVPVWTMDGSSTCQAETKPSDRILQPVCLASNPLRGEPHKLVLCEVLELDGKIPHPSNTRNRLAYLADHYKDQEPWFGIEQEYTLFDQFGKEPLYWEKWKDQKQGRFYCGVGSDVVFGSDLVEEHLNACIRAGIRIEGTNSEVMAAQHEFQVGPLAPLELADQFWLARYLLQKIGQRRGVCVKFDPKPKDGDWNGAGAHTNFSTKFMREINPNAAIEMACFRLKVAHVEHMKVYGADNEKRLTGKHETCDINTFKYGKYDRGASVRIPFVPDRAPDHIEDRRPAANIDPYEVCAIILETVCGA